MPTVKILVINAGSSSLKCSLFAMPDQEELADALVEKIGEGDAFLRLSSAAGSVERPCDVQDHSQALDAVLDCMVREAGVLSDLSEIAAVGHRVVHGGEAISHSVAVDEEVMGVIEQCAHLAPLHNPPNLVGLRAAVQRFPGRLQVAVFDTAFHRAMPPEAYHYALPYELYEQHRVRRYGFHGTSHRYVAERAVQMLGRRSDDCNLVTLHLGNGCSAAAVRNGQSVDTTMGFTPLEGLVMGTRCGNIDPALPFFFMDDLGMAPQEVHAMLNRRSGLLGLSGLSNDMRELLEAARQGHERAELAINVFCYQAKKCIGAYVAVLGRVHGIVFTGGIGENGDEVRARICRGLEPVGICLSESKNRSVHGQDAVVSTESSPTAILVVHTDEALKIAQDTYEIQERRPPADASAGAVRTACSPIEEER